MNEFYQSPYPFVMLVLLVIVFLFCIRHYLKNTKKQPVISIGSAQILGRRNEQEDCFSTVTTESGIMAVLADGMGGYSNGKIASNVAVNTYADAFTKAENIYPVEEFLMDTARLSNMRIYERGNGEKIGTTLVVVVVSEDYLYWASVGDSAIVLFRNNELINLNKKHVFESVLEEKYISGKISKEEMMNNSKKKRLTNYMGHKGFKDIEVNEKAIQLRPGDKVILCSDGVYNSINEIELERALMKKIKPSAASEEIMGMIREKNLVKQDNATIVILEKK